MTDILFVDLDGVLSECIQRERQANRVVEEATQSLTPFLDKKGLEQVQKSVFYHESVFYNPYALLTDTLIENAAKALQRLASHYSTTIIITSRPEYTRKTTMEWLKESGIARTAKYHLVPKPPAANFIKTVTWKAATLDSFTMFLGGTHVDFIDNEKEIRDEVLKYLDTQRFTINVYESLEEAIRER